MSYGFIILFRGIYVSYFVIINRVKLVLIGGGKFWRCVVLFIIKFMKFIVFDFVEKFFLVLIVFRIKGKFLKREDLKLL